MVWSDRNEKLFNERFSWGTIVQQRARRGRKTQPKHSGAGPRHSVPPEDDMVKIHVNARSFH